MLWCLKNRILQAFPHVLQGGRSQTPVGFKAPTTYLRESMEDLGPHVSRVRGYPLPLPVNHLHGWWRDTQEIFPETVQGRLGAYIE